MLPNYAETAISAITMAANVAIAIAAVTSAVSYNRQTRSQFATTDRMKNISEFHELTSRICAELPNFMMRRHYLEYTTSKFRSEAMTELKSLEEDWYKYYNDTLQRMEFLSQRIGQPAPKLLREITIISLEIDLFPSQEEKRTGRQRRHETHAADLEEILQCVSKLNDVKLKADEFYHQNFK